jgi:hypothetical protein
MEGKDRWQEKIYLNMAAQKGIGSLENVWVYHPEIKLDILPDGSQMFNTEVFLFQPEEKCTSLDSINILLGTVYKYFFTVDSNGSYTFSHSRSVDGYEGWMLPIDNCTELADTPIYFRALIGDLIRHYIRAYIV